LVSFLTDELCQREREIENLQFALHNSRRIGAAVGIVMASDKCTYDAAFESLSRCSQTLNAKLVRVADFVLETGARPVAPGDVV
jgi:AmiR/NasT family two-component response regulator